MKVFVAVGAKKNGNTDKIIEQFVQGALSVNHDVIIENLFQKKMYMAALTVNHVSKIAVCAYGKMILRI